MMPLAPTAPGVHVREESSGVRTITGVSVSITAFLGRALRGPVNRPVIVNSFGEFERTFGGLWAGAALGYAVRSFFLNGGGQAVVVRLYKPMTAGDGLASLTIGGVRLDAVEPGAWGNGISATLDSDGITDDVAQRYGLGVADLFNLSVTGAGVVERFVNLTVADNARRIDRVLAQQSRLVSAPVSGLPTTSPTGAATEQASGGDDGGSLGVDEFIGSQAAKTGLYALDLTDIVNLLVIPPDTVDADVPTAVYQAAISYAASRRAVVLVDPPAAWDPIGGDPSALLGLFAGPDSRNAALFFPRVLQSDPIRGAATGAFVPGGAIAGVIARTDAQRGIWKAPAGVDATISGVIGLAVNLTDAENGRLNPLGINSLRSFPAAGVVVWGARTLRGADQLADEYKYLPVRRLALYIEESLSRGSRWAVFEPNDEPLWSQLRLNVGVFLHELFRQGAFAGRSPAEAYFVQCDRQSTTQSDVDSGIVNIVVGFAPLKPAEFVVITIRQIAGQLQA